MTAPVIYAAPVAIGASGTLRIFSTDAAGNAGTVREETYTIGP